MRNHLLLTSAALFIMGSSCTGFRHKQQYVHFDDAMPFCAQSRDLVNIVSKMIPSDETLDNRNQMPGMFPEHFVRAEAAGTGQKTLNESEGFVTMPEGKFAVVKVEEGKHIVYWIHLVSANPALLQQFSGEEQNAHRIINEVIRKYHAAGILQSKSWEDKLNAEIASELKKQKKYKSLARVFIHLGC